MPEIIREYFRRLAIVMAGLLCAVVVRADTTDVTFSFPVPSPQNITISVGDSVRFTGPSSFHPLEQVTGPSSDTAVSAGFSSTSSPFTFQFQSAGTFYYRCMNHGVAALNGTMRGSITVQQAVQPTATSNSGTTNTPVPTPSADCQGKPQIAILNSPLLGASVSKAKVTLDWSDVECATSYTVVLRKAKKSGSVLERKSTTKSVYKTNKLDSHQTYFWSVKACNRAGCSAVASSNFSRP